MKAVLAALVVAIALARPSLAAVLEDLPTERPAGCNTNTCDGCTPFQPPRDTPGIVCGEDDFYFPVPVLVVRNDTSAQQALVGQQWACVACCTAGCGYDNAGSGCTYRVYKYAAGEEYGCTKCSAGFGKVNTLNGVKTGLEDLSTGFIYSTITTPYTGAQGDAQGMGHAIQLVA